MILSLKKDLSSLSFSYSKAGLSFSDSRCQDQIPKASRIRVNQVVCWKRGKLKMFQRMKSPFLQVSLFLRVILAHKVLAEKHCQIENFTHTSTPASPELTSSPKPTSCKPNLFNHPLPRLPLPNIPLQNLPQSFPRTHPLLTQTKLTLPSQIMHQQPDPFLMLTRQLFMVQLDTNRHGTLFFQRMQSCHQLSST